MGTRLAKVWRLVLIGAVALGAVLLAGLWAAKPAKSKWSRACNGVQVMLSSPCSRYRVGEVIKIYVKFRNIGEKAQTIKMASLYATTNWSCNKGAFADGIGYYPKGTDELKLLPGQTSEGYYLQACGTEHEGAGIYEISGGMGNDERWGWNFERLYVNVSRWF